MRSTLRLSMLLIIHDVDGISANKKWILPTQNSQEFRINKNHHIDGSKFSKTLLLQPNEKENTTHRDVTFLPVIYVSTFNLVVNILRPDPAIVWQARVPRALWEICIAVIATRAKSSNPIFCLVLALMTISTALIDIFIWAPGFAMFASFETCTGGGIFSRQPKICKTDYVKGAGRLFTSVQSLLTGLFYLVTSVVSWSVFVDARDSKIAIKNADAMAKVMANR